MNTYFLKLTVALALMFSVTHPGVIISIDVPERVADIVKEHQDSLACNIEQVNEQLHSSYQFSKAQFSPHISLAFVSQEQLSTQATQEKYPGLKEELAKLASQFSATDITDTYKNLTFDYWPGKFEMECGGL